MTIRSCYRNDPLVTGKKVNDRRILWNIFSDTAHSMGFGGFVSVLSGKTFIAGLGGAAAGVPVAAGVGYYAGYKLRQWFPRIDTETQSFFTWLDSWSGGWLFGDFGAWGDRWLGGGLVGRVWELDRR